MEIKRNFFGKIFYSYFKMKIPVLVYHSINNNKSNLSLTVNDFEKQIKFLNKSGFETIGFDKIEKDKKKQIIITFDDENKDICQLELPILKKYNFKTTCFLVSILNGKKNSCD